MQKITKAEFARTALKNGLALLAAPWNISEEKLLSGMDNFKTDLKTIKRDKVTGTASKIIRNGSRLDLDGRTTVYKRNDFFIVKTVWDKDSESYVIYV